MNNNRGRLANLNGQNIPEGELRIPPFDSQLLAGDGVFDLARTFNRKLFQLDEHLQRLFWSMRSVGINCGLGFDELKAHCGQLLEANLPFLDSEDDYQLLVDVTRGEFPLIRHVTSSPMV